MSPRFALHSTALLVLLALGIGLIYQSAYQNSLSGLYTAVYWFGYLIYVLLACGFFLVLKRRSGMALTMAHVFSGFIALLVSVVIVQLGERYNMENNTLSTLDPKGGQELKIPAKKDQQY